MPIDAEGATILLVPLLGLLVLILLELRGWRAEHRQFCRRAERTDADRFATWQETMAATERRIDRAFPDLGEPLEESDLNGTSSGRN